MCLVNKQLSEGYIHESYIYYLITPDVWYHRWYIRKKLRIVCLATDCSNDDELDSDGDISTGDIHKKSRGRTRNKQHFCTRMQ